MKTLIKKQSCLLSRLALTFALFSMGALQVMKAQQCTNNSAAYNNQYKLQADPRYAATPSAPLITLKITLHVFYNGSLGYQPNSNHYSYANMQYIANSWGSSFDRYSA